MFFTSNNTIGSSGFLNEGLATLPNSHSKSARRFLATASLTAMAVMMSTAAQAQKAVDVAVLVPAQSGIPAGCTPDPVAAGGTLTCTGTITERLDTNVDDLTVVIGTAATPATVTTSGGGSAAIRVDNSQGIDITVAAGSTVTGGEGIYADNNGSGSVTLTIDGEVTGTNSYGIYAENAGDNLTITATAAISGQYAGILAENDGTGATTITTAAVTGGEGDAIDVDSEGSSLTLVTNGDIQGAGFGIDADVGYGATGGASITTNGTVTGSYGGIDLNHEGSGIGAIVITANDSVTGTYDSGIEVDFGDYGTTSATVTAADVMGGENGYGIDVSGGENSTNISITSTGAVTAGRGGINVNNYGTGNTTVNAVDSVATGGNYSYGIDVRAGNYFASNGNTGSVSVSSTGTAMGTYNGIRVRSYGTGDVTVESVDSIGANDYGYGTGIDVRNRISRFSNQGADAGDIIISSTGTATGGETGISVRNSGTGNIVVNAVDSIGSNSYGEGIRAYSTYISGSGTTGDISITSTGNSEGGRYGITASNRGSGTITINAVNASADASRSYSSGGEGGETTLVVRNSGVAVNANGGENGGNISINTTGVVDGSLTGIRALTSGSASTTIDISGSVSGGENGVLSETLAGANVILREGGSITGPVAIDTEERFRNSFVLAAISGPNDGPADVLDIAGAVNGDVFTNDGVDTINLASTGSLNGDTFLGDGDDIFNDAGGSFMSVSGGENSDTFNVNAGGRTFASSGTSDVVTLFEIFNLNSGVSSFAGTHSGIQAVNIASGAGLNLADGASVNGVVTNEGSLDIADGLVGMATFLGDFTQAETGSASFDRISETEADLLNVVGDVTLGGTLNLNQTDVFIETVTLIDGGEGISGAFDQVNGLAEGIFITQDIEIDTANADVNLVTTILEDNDEVIMSALSPNQASLVEDIGEGLRNDALSDDLDGLVRRLGSLSSPEEVAQIVEELSPEFATVGLQNVQARFADFTTTLVNRGLLNTNIGGATQTASLFPSAGINQDSGPRAWLNAGFISVEQDGSANTVDFETDGYEFAIGISNIDAGPVSLGFAAGYSEFDTETSSDAFGGAGADDVDTELLLLGVHSRFDINEQGAGLNGHFDVALSYADGEHEFTQNIAAGDVDATVTQTGETDVSHIGAVARMTFSGLNGEAWPIKPYVKAGVDNYEQNAFTIGTGATSLDISGIDNTRYSVGYGADYKHALENSAYFRVGASGTHYFGDTEGELISSFSGAADSGFSTVGEDVDSQFVVEGGLGTTLGAWTIEASGFGQFGDLEGYGGNLNFSTPF